MAINFSGIHIPVVTPFRTDSKKSVDESALKSLVEYSIKVQKADGIVPCGTTGESPTLSHEEHAQIIEIVIGCVKGRVPVIAATGSNSTEEAIRMTKHAEEAGADATLQVGPYYNKPTQEGMFAHFKAISESTSLPILIYNIPGRTGKNIEPKTLLRLWAGLPNIVGVKDCSCDAMQTMELVNATRGKEKPFFVLTGEDISTYSTLCLGGHGAISAVAHIVGAEYKQMCSLMLEKKEANYQKKALDIHYKTMEIVKNLFIETNPTPIKEALQMMGITQNSLVRLPLVNMLPANREILRKSLIALGKIKT